ncbi:MAG: hypothetical protein JXA71_13835 [Chitinispirillaceae bacterium]|nr:hypothetical protein [Chitinispirillaceae bacterium]
MNRLPLLGLAAALLPASLFGAATNLPDISVLGDLTAQTSTDEDYPGRNQVTLREIELAFQGYLYPEIRADIFLAMHRHEGAFEPEVCEASVSFLRLFFDGLGMQAGKVHIDFGKLNKIHQHERPFMDQPLVLTDFFGPHGLAGEGAVVNYLLPLPFFLRIDGGVWWIPGHAHDHAEEEDGEPSAFGLAGKVYTARLWSGFSLGDRTELEIGASGASGNGSHFLEHQDDVMIGGADLTLRFLPRSHRRIIWQTELFFLNRQVPVGTLKRLGAYSYLGVQFNRYWDAGVRYDLAENAFPEKAQTSLASAFGSYRFTETTRLRAQYGFDHETSVHHGAVQIVFGIGPHSHPLQ